MYLSTSLLLSLLQTTVALLNAAHTPRSQSETGTLIIADEGVDHRSLPVTYWQTSLRRLTTSGTNASTIQTFGPASLPNHPAEPIGGYALTIDPITQNLYISTSQGIIRTTIDGSNPTTILKESDTRTEIMSLVVSGEKLYYGTSYEGLIKRANLDGSGIEVLLNISQGMNPIIPGSFEAAYEHATGLAIDLENELIYWSANRGSDNDGSIRRAPLKPVPANTNTTSTDAEILVENLNAPGTLRILSDGTLYWTELGRWSNSPTALKRAYCPPSPRISAPGAVPTETLVHSNQSSMFTQTDVVGDNMTLHITAFAVDERTERIWIALMSDARTMFGKVVEVLGGLGGFGQGGGFRELRVVDGNVTEVGLPVGLEYVPY